METTLIHLFAVAQLEEQGPRINPQHLQLNLGSQEEGDVNDHGFVRVVASLSRHYWPRWANGWSWVQLEGSFICR